MFIPGTKMVFVGIRDEALLDDLIAYLSEATR
jgi:cytochrome c2